MTRDATATVAETASALEGGQTSARAVLDLVRERGMSTARPTGSRRKLALIVEGGGMRGVLSAGSLLALDLLGFRSVFDEIYATSAGAVNASYFLSGQGKEGITVYFDDLCDRRFINPWRVNKMVDIDFVCDEVIGRTKQLDEATIRATPTKFLVSVTNVHSGNNELIDARSTKASISQLLKASSALPVVYNRVVRVDGGDYVDGGVSNSVPITSAIAAGCTDILVLGSRAHAVRYSVPIWQRALFMGAIGWRYPALRRAFVAGRLRGEENRRLLSGEVRLPEVNVALVVPVRGDPLVEKTEQRKPVLVDAALRMADRTWRHFSADNAELLHLFRTYRSS